MKLRLVDRSGFLAPSRAQVTSAETTSADNDQSDGTRVRRPASRGQCPAASVKRASTQVVGLLVSSYWRKRQGTARQRKAFANKSPCGFWDHRSLRWSFSFWRCSCREGGRLALQVSATTGWPTDQGTGQDPFCQRQQAIDLCQDRNARASHHTARCRFFHEDARI